MTYTDHVRRVRSALGLTDEQVLEAFALGGYALSADGLRLLLSAEDDTRCPPPVLGHFLDGLIVQRRGPRKGGPAPEVERMSNNVVFKKLRIAMNLHEPEVLRRLASGGVTLSPRELTALFRKPGHRHYKKCSDEVLQAFLAGLSPEG